MFCSFLPPSSWIFTHVQRKLQTISYLPFLLKGVCPVRILEQLIQDSTNVFYSFLSIFLSLFFSFFISFLLLCSKMLFWFLDVYCFCSCWWRHYFIFTAPLLPIPRVTSVHSFLPHCRLQHSVLLHGFPDGQGRPALHPAFIIAS